MSADAFAAIYAQVPDLECQGLCHESCGPLVVSAAERERIEQRTGKTIHNLRWTCSALTVLKRCSIYEDRPLLCRLWGVVESMPCEWGCKPARVMSDAEGHVLLRQIAAVGTPSKETS